MVDGMEGMIPLEQTEMWLDNLRRMGRKENSIRSQRSNVKGCLRILVRDGMVTDAFGITEHEVLHLWKNLTQKENVKWSYLRSFANMVMFHTGRDVVKDCNILHNRVEVERVFITRECFRVACIEADPMQRVILCLGAYMGLRRAEMSAIRDSDFIGNTVLIHGKGHGDDGLVVRVHVPAPVMDAIWEYRASGMKWGLRDDDHLLQSRGRNGRLHRLDPSRISDSMKSLGDRIGMRITTHSLRRFYATVLFYDVECDLQTMRNMMRHSQVTTTLRCYVDADDRREEEARKKLVDMIDRIREGKEEEKKG